MLVEKIESELEGLINPVEQAKRIEWEQKYNEPSRSYGIKAASVRRVSSKFYQRVKNKSKEEILSFCNELLAKGIIELRTIAFEWAYRLRKCYVESDFEPFEAWLKRYVHGWGGCDDLCTHAFGAFVYQFPEFIREVKKWTKSANTWLRRASAVVLIYSIRRKQALRDVFTIADMLLNDDDLMVQKGYGWMLKEASNRFPNEVYDYVMRHRREMPRTTLRYAIEKLPAEMKKACMSRS